MVFFHAALLQSQPGCKHLILRESNWQCRWGWWAGSDAGLPRKLTGCLHEFYSKVEGQIDCLVPVGRMDFYLKRKAFTK